MSGQPCGVIASGHWIVDVSKRIDHWPEPETLAVIDHVASTNGGAAFNLACDLAKLDDSLPVLGMGLIGNDGPGQFILDTCNKAGIKTSGIVRTDEAPTSFSDVMTERSSGRRTFFHAHGTMNLLDESHFEFGPEDGGIFYLGYLGLIPRLDSLDASGGNASSRLFRKARALGMTTASDLVSAPNPDLTKQVAPCLPYLDCLFANEWEASRLMGNPLSSGTCITFETAASLARGLIQLGLEGRAVIHFAGGAVCAEPGGTCHAIGAVNVPDAEIIGTTGAGDAFAAGFICGVALGMDTVGCLELAVCSAAVSLGALTCSDALRPRGECLEYGRTRGFALNPTQL